jgi:hypothetical protein
MLVLKAFMHFPWSNPDPPTVSCNLEMAYKEQQQPAHLFHSFGTSAVFLWGNWCDRRDQGCLEEPQAFLNGVLGYILQQNADVRLPLPEPPQQ